MCLSYSEHRFWIRFQTPDGQQVFTLTCWQVGRWSAAWLIAMIFPAGLVRRPHRTAVSLALFHCPGAGLPFTFHQCLTPTHLLQEAFFNVLWLYPGLFLLPGGGGDYKFGNVTFTNKVVKSLESGKENKMSNSRRQTEVANQKRHLNQKQNDKVEETHLGLDGPGFFAPSSLQDPSYIWLITVLPNSHIS